MNFLLVATRRSTLLAFVLLMVWGTSLVNAEKLFQVESFSLNAIDPVFDGNWQGITTASDGACYFGSSTHSPSRGAGFFRFHPEHRKVEILADDLTVVCGEDPEQSTPQGKVHSPIVEHDGWIYFTTHLANYWDEARDVYSGAHVLGYELATGKFRDFGVMRPRFSVYSAIQVDPVHDQLYVFVVPMAREDMENDGTYLYRIDIASGEKEELAKVIDQGRAANFWFYVDAAGTCWFTIWREPARTPENSGHLYYVKAGEKEIHRYEDVLPEGLRAPDGEPAPEEGRRNRSWTWAVPIDDGRRAVFTMGRYGGGDERVWLFDPSLDVKSGEAFIPLGYIGSTFLSVALGGDRVYFVQYRDLDDARSHTPENIRDRDPERVQFPAELHLRSVSIAKGKNRDVKDHGRIVDQDGRTPLMIESLAADDAGRVYMVGSWSVNSEEEATLQYVWEGQGFWPDLEPWKFHRLERGEFFAWGKANTE